MKKFVAILSTVVFCFSFVACGQGNSVKPIAENMAALPHFDGITEDGSYDSNYFYRNDLHVFGGDPDVEWVPEERDPVYGGYFYMITSGNDGVQLSLEPDETRSVITCLRSKDLNDWELCGEVANGFCVTIGANEWVNGQVWAPEMIYNPNDGKYYLYTTGMTPRYADREGYRDFVDTSKSEDGCSQYDRFCGAVFMSDTPVGPFRLATSERYYGSASQPNLNGKIIGSMTPQMDPKHDCPGLRDDDDFGFGKKGANEWEGDGTPDTMNKLWGFIDMSPFFDDDGTLYIYYTRHKTSGYNLDQQSFVMRMKDMITPDWESMRLVSSSYGEKVVYKGDGKGLSEHEAFVQYPPYKYSSYEVTGHHRREDVMINDCSCTYKCGGEGPFMVHIGDRYYLTKTYGGFGGREYVANQMIGDNPLGPFTEVPYGPGCVVGVNQTNDYMTGIGHTCYVEKDGEMYSISFAHADPFNGTTAGDDGRIYCFDRVTTIEDENFGTLLYGNGPTNSLQPKIVSQCAGGMRNIAGDATVTATNAKEDTIKYLNDGRFVSLEYYAAQEFEADGRTTITLEFPSPREIGAIMVYNSFDYEYAFSSVDLVQFGLTETPSWYKEGELGGLYIKNLPFNTDYVNLNDKFMRAGGSALASFDPIKVNKIQITISQKFKTVTNTIKVSDIVVLGK